MPEQPPEWDADLPEAGARLALRRDLALLAALIAARTAVFTTLNWLQFRSFYAIEWQDTATALQIIYQTAHGHWFYQSITGEVFFGHVQPIYALLAAAYALAPHPLTVFAIKSLGFSLGAAAIYLLTLRGVGRRSAAWGLAIAYLLYAPLNWLNLGDVRGVAFSVSPILFALYFFETRRPWAFAACAVLAMSCKENVAFVFIMFGAYALVRRRRWPWVVGPMLLGAAWFAIALKVVMPHIFSGAKYSTRTYFNHWGGGGSPFGLAWIILSDPMNHLRLVLSQARRVAAAQWLAPVCLLPLLAPEALLLAAPGVAQIALLRRSYFSPIQAHWFTIPSTLIFAAATLGAIRLLSSDTALGRRLARYPRVQTALPWIVAGLCLVSNFGDNIMTRPRLMYPLYDARFAAVRNMYDPVFFRVTPEDRRLWRIIERIPARASVAATGHLLPALAGRPRVASLWSSGRDIHGQPLRYTDCDYLLLDWRNYYHGGGWYPWLPGDKLKPWLVALLARGGWSVEVEDKTTLLLRKDRSARMPRCQAEAIAQRLMREWLRVQGYACHIERADRALADGRREEAAAEGLAAIQTVRPDPYPYRMLCGLYLACRDNAKAIEFARVAVRLNPYDAFSWYRIALAYSQMGEVEPAIAGCHCVLRVYPHTASTRALLALLYQAQGREAAARREVRIALKIKPDEEDAIDAARRLGVPIGRPPRQCGR